MGEGMRSPVEESFQSKVLGKVPVGVGGRRPLRPELARVFPQGARCGDGGRRPAFLELGSPMRRVGVANGGPVARGERLDIVVGHGSITANAGGRERTAGSECCRRYRISSVAIRNPGSTESADRPGGASRRSGGEPGRYTKT